jgi:GAF domain-containing protein
MRGIVEELRIAYSAGQVSRQEAAVRLSKHVCQLLPVPLASLWELQFLPEGAVLSRIGGYNSGTGEPLLGPLSVSGQVVHDYLCALRGGVFASEDVATDPRVGSLQDNYALPQSVRSQLDAVVGVNGVTLGVLCCEQRGKRRAWTSSETHLVRSLANEIAVAVARIRTETKTKDLLAWVETQPQLDSLCLKEERQKGRT